MLGKVTSVSLGKGVEPKDEYNIHYRAERLQAYFSKSMPTAIPHTSVNGFDTFFFCFSYFLGEKKKAKERRSVLKIRPLVLYLSWSVMRDFIFGQCSLMIVTT